MAFHRENVIWPSRDGTWNMAFYAVEWRDTSDEADTEYDVTYDYGAFDWVSSGHVSPEAARDSWQGTEPGKGTLYEISGADTDVLDLLARTFGLRWDMSYSED